MRDSRPLHHGPTPNTDRGKFTFVWWTKSTNHSIILWFIYRSPFKYCVLMDGFLPGKKEGLLSAKLILEVVCTSGILRV